MLNIKITLSLWDIGGQKRFEFFKTDFFKGTAAIGLVFDLSRPDTFEKVDTHVEEIHERSGNIPVLLVGNKDDLTKEIGETIARDKIIQKVNQYNLFEYIETSALKNHNVEKLFNRLAIMALLDLRPRLGEFINSDHFRFKVLLIGSASVGKSSLIQRFTSSEFQQDYKLTIGLDFMIQDFEIPNEDLPKEVRKIVRDAISNIKKKSRTSRRKAKSVSKKKDPEGANIEVVHIENVDKKKLENGVIRKKSIFLNKYFYIGLVTICAISFFIILSLLF